MQILIAEKDEINFNFMLRKGLDLVLALFLCLFLPRLATHISNRIFLFASTLWNFSHHILQMFFALIIMNFPLWSRSLTEWGFNTHESEYTIKILKQFTAGFIIFLPIGTIITQVLSGWPWILTFPATWRDFLVNLRFSVTMPGLSEEILFRALCMGILAKTWRRSVTISGIRLSHPNIIAAIIFALAHVGFTVFPFRVIYFNSMQLVFAVGLGLLYGYVYDKTGSLLGPILLHNISDGVAVTTYFLITKIFM